MKAISACFVQADFSTVWPATLWFVLIVTQIFISVIKVSVRVAISSWQAATAVPIKHTVLLVSPLFFT